MRLTGERLIQLRRWAELGRGTSTISGPERRRWESLLVLLQEHELLGVVAEKAERLLRREAEGAGEEAARAELRAALQIARAA